MRRYWVDAGAVSGDQVRFEGDVFHHVFDVCRQDVGSKFEVIVPGGKALLVEVDQVAKHHATAHAIETRQIPPLPFPHINLVLSVCRYPVMDSVVERAVELGVNAIYPVFTDYSFIRSASSLPANKVDRWDKIVKSATQQCGRGELMPIHKAEPLKDLFARINRNPGFAGLFAYEGEAALSLRQGIQRIKERPNAGELKEIWLFVGSEGGYSTAEVEALQAAGLLSVTLGQQVLRVETACLALVSTLKYEFDLMC